MVKRLSIVIALVASLARPAGAKCPAGCLATMCAARSSLVLGSIEAEPKAVFGFVLVVESVLRLAPGARTPTIGERLPAREHPPAGSRVVGAYPEDLSLPLYAFPVRADGHVQCPEPEDDALPAGKGVTPARLAELSGLPDFRDCQAELMKAGYPPQGYCDDTPTACAAASGTRGLAFTHVIAMSALVLLARRRR